jgi:hypothetical protein
MCDLIEVVADGPEFGDRLPKRQQLVPRKSDRFRRCARARTDIYVAAAIPRADARSLSKSRSSGPNRT